MNKEIENDNERIRVMCTLNDQPKYTTGIVCTCEKCNREVWLSDLTIDAIDEKRPNRKEGDIEILCVECFQKDTPITLEMFMHQLDIMTDAQKKSMIEFMAKLEAEQKYSNHEDT